MPVIRSFGDATLFGDLRGSGPAPVVALHGWGRDHTDLVPVVDRTGGLALDLPGFGASPPPPEPWSPAEYARVVADVIDDLGGPVVVVGHSFGGRVALRLAATRPDAVSAVVISGVPLFRRAGSSRPPLAFRAARWLHRRGLVGERRMEAARRRHGSVDYRQARGVMREVLVRAVNDSYEDALTALRVPLELVWGTRDTAAPADLAREAARMVPGARLTLVDTDHLGILTDGLEDLCRAVERHLRSRGRTGP